MKKLVATILCLTMVMSLAACNGKQPEQAQGQETTVPDVVETVVPLTEPTTTPETTANLASDFVKCKLDKITVTSKDDEEDKEEVSFYVPELQIKSSYADSVNKEIASAYETHKAKFKGGESDPSLGTSYIAYLTKEGVLSLVFTVYTEDTNYDFKIYNIDTKTGEKIENARLAQIAGVSDIRKAAMDALQNFFNKQGEYELKDYKVVSEKDEDYESGVKDVEDAFGEEYLNDKMQIGLTNEGKMFFLSKIGEASGTMYSWRLYGSDGSDLDDEDNPFWTGAKEDDGDEEWDNSKETNAAEPALNKKDYLKDKVVKFKVKDEYNKKKKKWTYYNSEYHFPELLIKSSYADSINKVMDKLIKGYKKEYKNYGHPGDCGTEYIAYLTKEGILSIVFITCYENDQYECKVYNIDVKTGEKVDNARIAQIAGVSNIRKTAMDALQARYNKRKIYKIKNYKVVKKKGQKKDEEDKAVEKTFSAKNLNDKMRIGLTNEGKIFFVSEYCDGCCDDNNTVYDATGKDLHSDKNPNWVGQKYD